MTDPATSATPATPAVPAEVPAPRPARPLAEFALRIAAIAVGTAGAVLVALVSGFLVPLRIGSVPVPVCILIALAGNVLAIRFVYLMTGSKLAIVWPVLGWLVTTLPLTIRQTEGDLVITDSFAGLGLLFGGSVGLAVGGYLVVVRQNPPAALPPAAPDPSE